MCTCGKAFTIMGISVCLPFFFLLLLFFGLLFVFPGGGV